MHELTRVRKFQKALEKCIKSGDYKVLGAAVNFSITYISSVEIINFYDEHGKELDISEVDKCTRGDAKCDVTQRCIEEEGLIIESPKTFDNVSFDATFKDDSFIVTNVVFK